MVGGLLAQKKESSNVWNHRQSYDRSLFPAAVFADFTGFTGGSQPHTNMQPSLALNHIIALDGAFPSRTSPNDATMIGEVGIFAGSFAPSGWEFCEGQLLSIQDHQELFSILLTTFGGDGRTTFALPDLRGRAALGLGTGPGLSTYQWGQEIGSEDVTLTQGQLPSHNHEIPEPMTLTLLSLGGIALLRRR